MNLESHNHGKGYEGDLKGFCGDKKRLWRSGFEAGIEVLIEVLFCNRNMDQIFMMDTQQKAVRERMARQLKINDSISFLLAVFGIILAYFEYEDFYGNFSSENSSEAATTKQYQEDTYNIVLRVLIGISSVCLCITIVIHYQLKIRSLKMKQKLDHHETLFSTKMVWQMLFELVICIIHCPPGFNFVFTFQQYGGKLDYSLDMFTFLIMLCRIYLIWRVFEHYTTWNNDNSEDICNSCLCEGGVKFAIKAELKERPYTVVISMLFVSILVFGIALRTAERPFMHISEKDWDYTWNGMWCIIITMSTVGYGDFYPVTHLGRLIDVIACFWGTFLVSMMVLSLSISSELTPQERKAYDIIKKKEAKANLEIAAINTIKSAIRLRLFLRKNILASEKSKAGMINRFKRALITYRTLKRNIKAREQDAPFEFILAKLNEKVSYGLDEIKSKCYVYKTLLARLDTSEFNQQTLKNNIDNLKEVNLSVLAKLERIKASKKLAY